MRGRGRALPRLERSAPHHRSRARSHCTTAHPLHTRYPNIFGTSISETTMRPNPTPHPVPSDSLRAGNTCHALNAAANAASASAPAGKSPRRGRAIAAAAGTAGSALGRATGGGGSTMGAGACWSGGGGSAGSGGGGPGGSSLQHMMTIPGRRPPPLRQQAAGPRARALRLERSAPGLTDPSRWASAPPVLARKATTAPHSRSLPACV